MEHVLALQIPTPIFDRISELNKLIEDYPEYIPLPEAAEFLHVSPVGLRHSILSGQCPFGFGWQKIGKVNNSFKIPSLTFYLWYTQCCGFRYNTVAGNKL